VTGNGVHGKEQRATRGKQLWEEGQQVQQPVQECNPGVEGKRGSSVHLQQTTTGTMAKDKQGQITSASQAFSQALGFALREKGTIDKF
jgi:hypothetical protein